MHAPGNENHAAAPGPGFRPWLWLVGSGVALAAGLCADVEPDGATWFGIRGPRCPLGTCLGELHCPGCGLLRATAAALQGDFADSISFHPGGLLIAALLPVTLLVQIRVLRARVEAPAHLRLRRLGHRALVAAVVLGWALRYALPH